MIVVDASVVVDFLLGEGSDAGNRFADLLEAGEPLCAPHLLDVEVAQVLRRYVRRREVSVEHASFLLTQLVGLPILRYRHELLLARAFELGENLTIYDGVYVALAELGQATFVTGDTAFLHVSGTTMTVEHVATGTAP